MPVETGRGRFAATVFGDRLLAVSSIPASRSAPAPDPTIFVRTLGGLSVTTSDGRDLAGLLAQPKRLALLIYLASEPRQFHRRDTLLPMFWSEADDAHARTALRNGLYFLRGHLGGSAIESRGSQEIAAGETVWSDASALIELAESGQAEEAFALYQGDMLPGFFLPNTGQFERWLEDKRAHLRSVAASLAWRLAEDAERGHLAADALRLARRAVAIEPTNEKMTRRLIGLLDRFGDRAGALTLYEELRQRLEREYEVSPSPETEALVARLRARRGSPTTSNAREADIAYERGTYLFLRAAHGGHPADLAQARVFFEEAIALAPDFAPAYAGLSNFFAVASVRGDLKPFEETFERAIDLSHRALALDPDLAIPHVHFGVKAMYLDADWETAAREFLLAISFEPAYPEGHKFYGILCGAMGRWTEAVDTLRETARLEPHIPLYGNMIAAAHMGAGSFDLAIVELERSLRLDPTYAAARDRLIRCQEKLGRYTEAIAERYRDPKGTTGEAFEREYTADGERGYLRARGTELRASIAALTSQLESGKPQTGGEVMNPLEVRLALAHAELGEWDAAMSWVERGCEGKPGRFHWFSCRLELAALRSSRRWIVCEEKSLRRAK